MDGYILKDSWGLVTKVIHVVSILITMVYPPVKVLITIVTKPPP